MIMPHICFVCAWETGFLKIAKALSLPVNIQVGDCCPSDNSDYNLLSQKPSSVILIFALSSESQLDVVTVIGFLLNY